MIDTIKAYMPLFELGLTQQEAYSLLEPLVVQIYDNDGYKLSFRGDKSFPFMVTISQTRILISGSLCKYYHGNNLQTLSYDDTKHALRKIVEDTRLPIHLFKLTRLDISTNIVLKEPPCNYMKMFEDINAYEKEKHIVRGKYTGVQFTQEKKEMLLYDKLKEQKYRTKQYKKSRLGTLNTKSDIRPVWHEYFDENGANVLRYEFRLKSPVHRVFGVDKLLVRDLTRSSIWNKMVRIWFIHFMKLRWRNTISRLPSNIKGIKDLENILLRSGIEYMGGIHATLKMIEVSSKNKIFDNPQQPYRLKKKLKQIDARSSFSELKDEVLYYELRKKILAEANKTILRVKSPNPAS